MNVIGKFSYSEDMKIIEDYLKQKGYVINCKPEELEKIMVCFLGSLRRWLAITQS